MGMTEKDTLHIVAIVCALHMFRLRKRMTLIIPFNVGLFF
jgi:hypothetical protein